MRCTSTITELSTLTHLSSRSCKRAVAGVATSRLSGCICRRRTRTSGTPESTPETLGDKIFQSSLCCRNKNIKHQVLTDAMCVFLDKATANTREESLLLLHRLYDLLEFLLCRLRLLVRVGVARVVEVRH